MINFSIDLGSLSDWLMVVLTLSVAVMAFVNLTIMRRIVWFTGAMERHSDQQRQIAAHKADIKLRWWDPTIGPFPPEGRHDQEVTLDVMYIGIPMKRRKYKGWHGRIMMWWKRVRGRWPETKQESPCSVEG